MHQALQLFQRVSLIICNAPGIAADNIPRTSSLHLETNYNYFFHWYCKGNAPGIAAVFLLLFNLNAPGIAMPYSFKFPLPWAVLYNYNLIG